MTTKLINNGSDEWWSITTGNCTSYYLKRDFTLDEAIKAKIEDDRRDEEEKESFYADYYEERR